jgi:hypothetical protein
MLLSCYAAILEGKGLVAWNAIFFKNPVYQQHYCQANLIDLQIKLHIIDLYRNKTKQKYLAKNGKNVNFCLLM